MPRWAKAAVLGLVGLAIVAVVTDPPFLPGGGDGSDLPAAAGPAAAREGSVGLFAATADGDGPTAVSGVLTSPAGPTEPDLNALLERIDASPDDPSGWMELGELLVEAGDHSRASEAYAAAVAADGANAEARAGLGKSLLFMGLLRVARAELGRAIALDPELAEAQLYLGITYSHSAPTDMDAAFEAWNAVLALAPDSEFAHQAQTYLDNYGSDSEASDGSPEPPDTGGQSGLSPDAATGSGVTTEGADGG